VQFEKGVLPMQRADEALNLIREHFAETSPEDFATRIDRYCPKLLSSGDLMSSAKEREYMNQLLLLQPHPTPLPLDAYLACALTGLTNEQRQLVFQLSDVVATVCQEQAINLYEPRKKTDPVYHTAVPDSKVFAIDRDRVLSSDLVIHLCHYASTGSGEELDFAYSALVPIILISHEETKVSRMITGIPAFKFHISYQEPEELRQELRERLIQIRPILEERKLAFSEYDVNVVGERIRLRREELQLTREDVARCVPPLTVDALRMIEESIDRSSNPALLQLRQIATVLKTTVADLVEPDLGSRLVGFLEEWVSGKVAARSGINVKDRNRILRRVLLRLIDSLEEE
jgi:transcriptional regulator with XRE-family HTH domain